MLFRYPALVGWLAGLKAQKSCGGSGFKAAQPSPAI